ncbi:hypothetical protein SAMN05444161_2473 [Rhizobiales bacterium GAS191]|jgi:hypothetical protein|nr:hypothetical protein SAMN05519103_01587 [Rhizobiales bacterium GAS113]SEC14612.1 hypothetical protein SAMN05519104_0841 [Rhizobiales bacterium GAS188]SED08337.1 hypothetical protein SAMN05444161_2473 [Rhizobiales bacterium GAS191]
MLELVMRRVIFGIALAAALMSFAANSPVSSRTLNSPGDWQGVWRGRYVCAQGTTGLTLTVRPSGANDVIAVFSFYAIADNPHVPSGQFRMFGQLGSKAGHLTLVARSWTHRPPFYVMVGLDGDYDPVSGQYKGLVDGPGCTSFVVQRDLIS